MPSRKSKETTRKRTKTTSKVPSKKGVRTRDAAKVDAFVERKAAGESGVDAVQNAGWEQSPRAAAVTASRLMSDPDIRARVERRLEEARARAAMETDVIIGSLAEIVTASVADVLEPDGSFDIGKCVARGTDHLIKKLETRERFTITGERIVTHKIEMYDRLNALSQLRDTYGMKEEMRPNSLDARRAREVEASLERIMARDHVDKPTAAKMLLESLKAIPHSEKAIEVVSTYVN
jgi:phage terminase small subunit